MQQEHGATCDRVCAGQTWEDAEGAGDETAYSRPACQDHGAQGRGRRDPGTGDQSLRCRFAWSQNTVGRTGRGLGRIIL